MKVLVTDFQWPDLEIEKSILSQVSAEIVTAESASENDLVQAAHGCQAIMTCWAEVTAKVIASADNCKIVSRMGIGLDNIDVDFCTHENIPVTNVPDYCVVEVAEHVMSFVFSIARQIPFFQSQASQGIYDLSAAKPFQRLQGQTLGLVGLGNIGRYLAQIAQGVGLNVIAHSRSPKNLPGVRDATFDEVIRESDFVSINVPLTEETNRLFDASVFAAMKPTAYLINTARGGIVDHDALADALNENQLAGAALDVQDPEPPDLSKRPFNDPRVLVTPHAAFVSEQSLADLRKRAATQVADRLVGKTPESIVNAVDI